MQGLLGAMVPESQKMTKTLKLLTFSLSYIFMLASQIVAAEQTYETDTMYRNLVSSVKNNDFDLMAEQYHRDSVVVSSKKTALLNDSIKRWRVDGEKLYADGGTASLEMRFKQRTINDMSAYETGIFHYQTKDKHNKVLVSFYMHFADLNVKINDRWRIMMERNVKAATQQEFESLTTWQ